jgi:hypothetical protein
MRLGRRGGGWLEAMWRRLRGEKAARNLKKVSRVTWSEVVGVSFKDGSVPRYRMLNFLV